METTLQRIAACRPRCAAATALLLLLLTPPLAALASETEAHLDKAPVNLGDKASLQRGARIFVNYCLTCHSAASMRYKRMEDLGLSEDQIKDNLMFASEKVGNTMTVAMRRDEAKKWFGAAPPDLSVIARARGADWLYTYLRSFYRDDSRPTGWNNTLFDKVAMPFVLYRQQGEQVLKKGSLGDAHGAKMLVLDKPGTMTEPEYDAMVGDLVNYLVYMGEPAQTTRVQVGVFVLLFLVLFLALTYQLKKEFWKDVH